MLSAPPVALGRLGLGGAGPCLSLEDHSHQTCPEPHFVHAPVSSGLVSTHLINIALTYSTMIFHETFINTHLTQPFTSFQCVLSLYHFLHSLSLASRSPRSPAWPFESCGFKKAAKEIDVTFAGDSHLSSHQILSVLKVSS